MTQDTISTTKVELWMEGETAHLAVHSSESATFARVKFDLNTMRDRLTAEIKNGPTLCPHAPIGTRLLP